jgi:putative transposase
MARPLRIEYPGAVYHLTSRGNGRENIFLKDTDRQSFMDILTSTVERHNWVCHAFCLMDNHYHLLIETPEANLSMGMRHLNGVYTQSFNRKHHRVGHIFQGRYKSILVQKDTHLIELCRYVVLNPVRANMVKKPEEWKWSSYNATAYGRNKPDFLTINWILGQFSLKKQNAQEKYHRFVNSGNLDQASPWERLTGQIFFGNDGFIDSIKKLKTEDMKIKEFPRAQRYANRVMLSDLFEKTDSKLKRNEIIWEAHVKYGYKMKEIADHLSVHYTTISKVINHYKK